jgi:lipopolysaccharide/colanic/teichoic acid biosynthesis glycosyltransferase
MGLAGTRGDSRASASEIGRSPAKRLIDYLIATLIIILTLPLMATIALTIKLVDPGPAIYLQRREGRNGRIFTLVKFRSMFTDSDERLERHFEVHPERRLEWARYFKLEDDPRVLPFIGAFMRRASLDELPNLFNVLTGAMSMVGPRPFPQYHLDTYDEAFLALRRSVRPGITGLWQLERGDANIQRTLDTVYITTWSLWLDVKILVRTVPAVVTARKAHY